MTIAVAVIASLAFIGWLIYRGIKGKPFKPHVVDYGVACVTGVFTLAYFLSMDIPQLVKIVASIILGAVLIVVASYFQHRRRANKS